MKNIFFLGLALLIMASCGTKNEMTINSPDGKLTAKFQLQDGIPIYELSKSEKPVITPSKLGFITKEYGTIQDQMTWIDAKTQSVDETWEQVWGEDRWIKNQYQEMAIQLKNAKGIKLNITFRLFNDGLAFQYEFPQQENMKTFVITNELTEINQYADHTAFWHPADQYSQESRYTTSKISEIDASKFYRLENDRGDRQVDILKAANTPVTFVAEDGTHICITEAALIDYSDMQVSFDGLKAKVELVPWGNGDLVRTQAPMKTPWRTIIVGDNAADLANSRMILNLNEPNKIANTSWIEPMVYTGIWWEMHLGKSSWAIGFKEGSWSFKDANNTTHGATTANAIRHIDFNKKHGIRGLLIEGWNVGWEYWGLDTVGFFDFQTPYHDFDLEKVSKYALDNGVALIGHHETSGDITNYEVHMEKAFALYHKLGVKAVKTGYAGAITPKGETNHGQFAVRHHQKLIELAAKYEIMIDAHEAIKDTGLRRTWPNFMSREAVRGQEYNAWSEGNLPEHTVILPFTRMMSGPLDYTPGIFDVTFDKYKAKESTHTTISKELALMVTMYSPVIMAADLPENYEGHPAFQFIRDLEADWEKSVTIHAKVGDYFTIARKGKKSGNWYLGSTTDEESRTFETKLDFLDENKVYLAKIYKDASNAHYENNPMAYEIETKEVKKGDSINIYLAPGGGQAITFIPKTN